MDNCPEFLRIHYVLQRYQVSDGGILNLIDKQKISELTEALKRTLLPNYTINEKFLRRITLFLLLQSELELSHLLETDFDYGHLIFIQITGSLLVHIVWGLGVQKFFYEIILFCPPVMGDELIKLIVAASLNVSECIAAAGDLAFTIFSKIQRIEKLVEAVDQSFKEQICYTYFFHFKTLLQSLVVPGNEFESLSDEHTANRYRLHSILKLTRLCFSEAADLGEPAEEYLIQLKYDYSGWEKECNISVSDLKLKTIEECTVCIKNSNISTSLWCQWVEIDSPVMGTSYQQYIGEEMHDCMRALEKSGLSEATELISVLASMSIKRKDEDDEIMEADLQTIMENVFNKSKTHSKWLRALLKVDTEVACFEKCLKSVERCVPVKYELQDAIFEFVNRSLKSPKGSVYQQRLKHLALISLKSFTLHEKVETMKYYFVKYGATTLLLTGEFSQVCTEIMNKAVSASANIKEEKLFSELIGLCFQSPNELLMRMLVEGVTNEKQTILMTKAFNVLQPLCQLHGFEKEENGEETALLTKIIIRFLSQTELRDQEEIHFVCLVTALIKNGIIERESFVEFCVFPSLHRCLLTNQWHIAMLPLKIIQAIIKDVELTKLVPMVVMLSQVIHYSRCDLLNFTSKKALVCDEACIIIKNIVPKLLQAGDLLEKHHINWIQHKISTLAVINKSYFLKLCKDNNKHCNISNKFSVESVIMIGLQNGKITDEMIVNARDTFNKEDVLHNFVKILPSLSAREWKSLSVLKQVLISAGEDNGSLYLFHLLAESLILINCIVKSQFAGNQHASACIGLCVRNFALFVQDEVLKESNNLKSEDLTIILEKMLFLLESLPTTIKESSSIFLMPMMKRILCKLISSESAEKGTCSEEKIKEMCSLSSLSSVRDVRIALARDIADTTY